MTSKKTLNTSIPDFRDYILSNNYFVDKSLFVKEFMNGGSHVSLMPRPRRFGKTFNLSMLEHFFDIQKPENKDLFTEFKIAKEHEFCKLHQNKYPVISITLKKIKEINWDNCLISFKSLISDLYERYDFLLQSDKLSDKDKRFFKDIYNETASEPKFRESLKKLSYFLRQHFNKKVIILVDEYDAPIINAFNNTNPPIKSEENENKTYYEKVISFMQTFLGEAYKGNKHLQKGLLTGIMRVGKESIFSDWNDVGVFDIQTPYFADNFGFTKEETKKLLTYFDLQDKLKDVQKWYNGYTFADKKNIYNPWSICKYVGYPKSGFKNYWANSGDYTLIKNRIIEEGVERDVQNLIEGIPVEKEIHENFVFQDFETDKELFWTLLAYSGYLTLAGKGDFDTYKLKIPNNEVKTVFKDIVKTWIRNEIKIKRDLLINTIKNLINNNIVEFENGFKRVIGDTFSYFDTAKNVKNPDRLTKKEQVYHVYTLGLLAILSDDYIIKSNRESGEGRYDIMLIPYDKNRHGIVIEFKSIEAQKDKESDERFAERVNTTRNKALQQIEKNKYYKELIDNKIKPENILKLPIVFAGKEPFVNELKRF